MKVHSVFWRGLAKCGHPEDNNSNCYSKEQQQQQLRHNFKMAVAMESRSFIKYIPPPSHPVNCKSPPDDLSDEILEWKERMKYIHDDIDWLLRLPAKKFWEQVREEIFSADFKL